MLPGWNSIQISGILSNIFFWVSIAALMLLGIAEVISHRYGERRDYLVSQQQVTEKQASDKEMARVQLETARANERAANLETEAAAANVRASEIMKATAWRQFTPEQITAVEKVLSQQPGKLLLAWIANDAESLNLATQFSDIAGKAHWTMSPSAKTYPAQILWGIHIPDNQTAQQSVKALREAFKEAGIPFFTDPLPQEAMSFGVPKPDPDAAVILFGSRRPTFAQPPY